MKWQVLRPQKSRDKSTPCDGREIFWQGKENHTKRSLAAIQNASSIHWPQPLFPQHSSFGTLKSETILRKGFFQCVRLVWGWPYLTGVAAWFYFWAMPCIAVALADKALLVHFIHIFMYSIEQHENLDRYCMRISKQKMDHRKYYFELFRHLLEITQRIILIANLGCDFA